MKWDDKKLVTYGDISDAMETIRKIEDPDERKRSAAAFMEAYRAKSEHADQNVGYLCGYFSHDTMVELLGLFQTRHPFFGGPVEAMQVTPEQAFEMGKEAVTGGRA